MTTTAWTPTSTIIKNANITRFMQTLGINNVSNFHQWTINHYPDFWGMIIKQLNIQFKSPPYTIVHFDNGIELPEWLPKAKMNISDSCFTAPADATAIIYQDDNKQLQRKTYCQLDKLSNQIANSLIQSGFQTGDAIAIAMPMNYFAVAIYLGIIKMGAVVVSIADSFSSQEMSIRLIISKAKGIFTQDVIHRSGKTFPLYEKIIQANAPRAIVIECMPNRNISIRSGDMTWNNFLSENKHFNSQACSPMDACNILFSSGTTSDPKAIIWNHTTAIKAASDAFFHQDIKPADIIAWPTNLGWMMGPWMVFAALINHASIALYPDAPNMRQFGEFVQNAGVTILGVVPTLVAGWRQTHCMEGLNWNAIKLFTSTGECSNPDDMRYLMSLGGGKPVIEYCGGTEIGGAYVSSTIIEDNYPSIFTTPTMGFHFTIINEAGKTDQLGEVAIIPPSMGLSTQLLNADHHQVYYAKMPKGEHGEVLRRHGDLIQRVPEGFVILGRVDDTMNLGGIKTSSAEIERTLVGIEGIKETAAIAISPPNNGPSQLIIYASTTEVLDKKTVQQEIQKRINTHLNPLFKVHDVVFVTDLPKTASNKIMRRELRKNYISIKE